MLHSSFPLISFFLLEAQLTNISFAVNAFCGYTLAKQGELSCSLLLIVQNVSPAADLCSRISSKSDTYISGKTRHG